MMLPPTSPIIEQLSQDEHDAFEKIQSRLRTDFPHLNQSSDQMQLEMAALLYVKQASVLAADEWEAAARIDLMIRAHLGDLKVTRKQRPEESGTNRPTLAEYCADLTQAYLDEGS